MAKIDKSVEVNASREQVFEALTDLDLLPVWSTITVETHGTPRKPIEEGDTFVQTLRVLGRHLESTWEVTQLQRPQRVAYASEAPGGGLLRMVQTVEDADGGSRVDVELDYELPGGFIGELVDSAYAERRNERELEHSLHNLKELVEGRASH
ncbi:SRPBCC family protein [Blastococcus capsensis]|uniref:SRPBCC family protein n=1 Tax=Blastococcus capsensis TaxID=1564163 RepID=UPI00253FFA08|nr:SRPBCC family protein [Blastococcus capsensis]MDK3257363.1 SRPBCC family protein [Blastococcus capsensis]